MKHLAWALGSALLALGLAACGKPAETVLDAPTCNLKAASASAAETALAGCGGQWIDANVRINQLQAIGTHNSYKVTIPENELAIIKAQVRIAGDGGIKPTELAQVLLDAPLPPRTRFARLSLLGPAGMDLCSPAALQQKGSPAANRPRPPAAPVVAEAVPSSPL